MPELPTTSSSHERVTFHTVMITDGHMKHFQRTAPGAVMDVVSVTCATADCETYYFEESLCIFTSQLMAKKSNKIEFRTASPEHHGDDWCERSGMSRLTKEHEQRTKGFAVGPTMTRPRFRHHIHARPRKPRIGDESWPFADSGLRLRPVLSPIYPLIHALGTPRCRLTRARNRLLRYHLFDSVKQSGFIPTKIQVPTYTYGSILPFSYVTSINIRLAIRLYTERIFRFTTIPNITASTQYPEDMHFQKLSSRRKSADSSISTVSSVSSLDNMLTMSTLPMAPREDDYNMSEKAHHQRLLAKCKRACKEPWKNAKALPTD